MFFSTKAERLTLLSSLPAARQAPGNRRPSRAAAFAARFCLFPGETARPSPSALRFAVPDFGQIPQIFAFHFCILRKMRVSLPSTA